MRASTIPLNGGEHSKSHYQFQTPIYIFFYTNFLLRCTTEQPIGAWSAYGWASPPHRCKHKAPFRQSSSRGTWGHSVFRPDHRIYLPSGEGQQVRGDDVFLEKVRGGAKGSTVRVCLCVRVYLPVHVCLRGGEWVGLVWLEWRTLMTGSSLACDRLWMTPKETCKNTKTFCFREIPVPLMYIPKYSHNLF